MSRSRFIFPFLPLFLVGCTINFMKGVSDTGGADVTEGETEEEEVLDGTEDWFDYFDGDGNFDGFCVDVDADCVPWCWLTYGKVIDFEFGDVDDDDPGQTDYYCSGLADNGLDYCGDEVFAPLIAEIWACESAQVCDGQADDPDAC